ncbi:MAG: hypothetical protein KTR29_05340 [Rhodothermaceae bacterium]|nr:hypothetical protein [Rhodothermaceae bacterium]
MCNLLFAGYLSGTDLPPDKTHTLAARLEAIVLDQQDTINVSIKYQLNKAAGVSTISYTGLEAFGTKIKDISATFNSINMPLSPKVHQLRIEGKIDLPDSVVADTSLSFVLSYKLINARLQENDQFHINIPLLWIENSSLESSKKFFEAHLVVPEKYYVKDSFPVNAGPCSVQKDPRDNCLHLQVLPTFLRYRGLIGHNPTFTAIKVLDYAILSLLVAACIFIVFLLTEKHTYSEFNV